MAERTSLTPGSNFGRYCQGILTDSNIASVVAQGKFPSHLAGTGQEFSYVGLAMQRDLLTLSHFNAQEILGEMNRDFCEGKGTIGYKFGSTQSGFVLVTDNAEMPEIFVGLVKDPQKFNAGEDATLGVGFGYSYVNEERSADYLQTAKLGLVNVREPNAQAIFNELMLIHLQNAPSFAAFHNIPQAQMFSPAHNPNVQGYPSREEMDLRAAAAANNNTPGTSVVYGWRDSIVSDYGGILPPFPVQPTMINDAGREVEYLGMVSDAGRPVGNTPQIIGDGVGAYGAEGLPIQTDGADSLETAPKQVPAFMDTLASIRRNNPAMPGWVPPGMGGIGGGFGG